MKFKILDCTLRDGGYYTNWNFDTDLVRSMVQVLSSNNVDIIELGYKSPKKGGPYRKCNDGFISSVIDFSPCNTQLSFMIDAKDYISKDEKINHRLLDDCINDSHSSPFSVCRLAIKHNEIEQAKVISKYLCNKGYTVFINLMGISLMSEEDIVNFVQQLRSYAKVLYLADSFGNLIPNKTKNICNLYKQHTDGECGVHFHDNLSLAFANSLEAVGSGFTYIDGTMCGMGRGVGNTKTEQLLLYRENIISSNLLDVVDSFKQLQQRYKWGYNTLYMLGGMNHIHPLYLQDLTLSNLNNQDMMNIAQGLKQHTVYDEELLSKQKAQKAVVVIPARYKSTRFPGKPLAKINNKPMILHVAEKAEQAVGKENVYIATENETISSVVNEAGYHVILTSDNCLTGTDRVAEASFEIDADIFVNVQGDEPIIDPEDIIKAIDCKKRNPTAVINCMSKLHSDEDCDDKKIPKIVCDKSNYLLYASRNALPGNKSGTSKNVMKQVCIYAFGRSELENFYNQKDKSPLEYQEDIEILRFVENGIKVKMLEVSHVSYAVDYEEDIATIERLIENGGV